MVAFKLFVLNTPKSLAERGLDVSYESIRYWVLKLGKQYAGRIDRRRPRPSGRWHLDENLCEGFYVIYIDLCQDIATTVGSD